MTDVLMPTGEGASNPIVFIEGGQVRATSRDVAAYFGKRHDNVVQAIRALLADEPGLNLLTFKEIGYVDARGRRQLAYSMNRDGFTLLAFGFTGPKAPGFKWAYIQAFNVMEADLRNGAADRVLDHKFPDWPLDEMRIKKGVADMYRMTYGPLGAQWIIPQLGFPAPPADMIELGRQLLLELVGGAMNTNGETVKKAA